MNTVAIYKDGVFQKMGAYPRVSLAEPVSTSDGTDFRIVREDPRPEFDPETHRLTASIIDDDGPDAEFPHLKVRRIRLGTAAYTLEQIREIARDRLEARYYQEQAKLTDLPEHEIDFRVAIMPVLNEVPRTNLTVAQRNKFIEERDKVVAYQTKYVANRTNAQTLRAAINAAATVAEVRAVDITGGWAV